MQNKRGLSPVIATVLLVAIVVVIGVIIFVVFKGIVKEAVTKDLGGGEQNIELACKDVMFEGDYSSSGSLTISNTGNIPIYDFDMKIESDEGYKTESLSNAVDEWSTGGIKDGDTKSFTYDAGSATITLIPVLLGNSDKGLKTYSCEDYGQEISG